MVSEDAQVRQARLIRGHLLERLDLRGAHPDDAPAEQVAKRREEHLVGLQFDQRLTKRAGQWPDARALALLLGEASRVEACRLRRLQAAGHAIQPRQDEAA